jgi:hypothetical protein
MNRLSAWLRRLRSVFRCGCARFGKRVLIGRRLTGARNRPGRHEAQTACATLRETQRPAGQAVQAQDVSRTKRRPRWAEPAWGSCLRRCRQHHPCRRHSRHHRSPRVHARSTVRSSQLRIRRFGERATHRRTLAKDRAQDLLLPLGRLNWFRREARRKTSPAVKTQEGELIHHASVC